MKIPKASSFIVSFKHKRYFRIEWYYPINENYNDPRITRNIKDAAAEAGLIPLFYLTDHYDLVKKVLNSMAEKRFSYIKDIYDLEHMADLRTYLSENEYVYNIDLSQTDKEVYEEFKQVLADNRDKWADDMFAYLTSCIR